jgi:hypothetical protein
MVKPGCNAAAFDGGVPGDVPGDAIADGIATRTQGPHVSRLRAPLAKSIRTQQNFASRKETGESSAPIAHESIDGRALDAARANSAGRCTSDGRVPTPSRAECDCGKPAATGSNLDFKTSGSCVSCRSIAPWRRPSGIQRAADEVGSPQSHNSYEP